MLVSESFPPTPRIPENGHHLAVSNILCRFLVSRMVKKVEKAVINEIDSKLANDSKEDPDAKKIDSEVKTAILQLQQWASHRGQTLYRTTRGMMYYQQAVHLMATVENIILHRKRRSRPGSRLKPEERGAMGGMDTTSNFIDLRTDSPDPPSLLARSSPPFSRKEHSTLTPVIVLTWIIVLSTTSMYRAWKLPLP